MKYLAMVILGILAILDGKKGWIRREIVLAYLLLCVFEGLRGNLALWDLMLGVALGGTMWIFSAATKEKNIGKADGAVAVGLGFMYGTGCFVILFWSFLFATLILFVRKKRDMAFLPVVFAVVLVREGCVLIG